MERCGNYVGIEFGRYLSKPISVGEVTRGCGRDHLI